MRIYKGAGINENIDKSDAKVRHPTNIPFYQGEFPPVDRHVNKQHTSSLLK